MKADLRISIKEFGGGFDRVTGRDDFGFASVEFVVDVGGADECAIGFVIEPGREGRGEEVIEFDVNVGDGKAGFN